MRKYRIRPDDSFFPAVSLSGYAIEKPGPRQRFTFRYRCYDTSGVYTTPEDVLKRCAYIDGLIEADKARREQYKAEAREKARREREARKSEKVRKVSRECEYIGYYEASTADILSAYNDSLICDMWD